jgi:integrase
MPVGCVLVGSRIVRGHIDRCPAYGGPMTSATMTSTRTSGVYRRGTRFAYTWRDAGGRQRWATADTEDEAGRERARRVADRRQADVVTLAEYAREWVTRYQGRTRTGIRELTRDEYRRDLENHVLPRMGYRTRLVDVTPRRVADLVAELARTDLADRSIKRVIAPLRACLHSAVAEGLLQSNPCASIKIPVRPSIVDDEDAHAKTLSDEQLARLLHEAPAEWSDLLHLLALTGLRISEALALRWRDVVLDGPALAVKVRQRYRSGTFEAPKSAHARRDVPLDLALAERLRTRRVEASRSAGRDLVFGDEHGEPWDDARISRPAIKRPGAAAGIPWVSFHVLRHTCASRLFASGRNVVQVQQWLGHHSAAFTLTVYVHLQQKEGIGAPLPAPAYRAPLPAAAIPVTAPDDVAGGWAGTFA